MPGANVGGRIVLGRAVAWRNLRWARVEFMNTRMGPVCCAGYIAVFYRVIVDIFNMPVKVMLISNAVFPKPVLPNAMPVVVFKMGVRSGYVGQTF